MPYALASNLTSDANDHASDLLSPAELKAMSVRFEANAAQWLTENAPTAIATTTTMRKPKSGLGRKPKSIVNPFYGFVGCTTHLGRYPVFAMDIIEGIARLDWHDRDIDVGGKSMPLSVRNLVLILESLSIVTNEVVEDLLQLRERHARRYVKAIELIMPWMMKSRPQDLINEMEGIEPEPEASEWDDGDNLHKPSAEELAKLHYDMRTFIEHKSAEEYNNLHTAELAGAKISNMIPLPARKQHPMKVEALGLLNQGINLSEVSRLTGVPRKTLRQWRDASHSQKLAA
ncbi:helix-turn-helix domain-containing protein [Pseudomonas psychrophila]|uniref:helix-turn-helix domain-containing protein n=1 Tax=Pseudomonas psychrophila TaxID=122355 RepID=UPI00037D5B7A|nr:helix-turn-helix domain-containing protein [Pseudomonas psychrophila]